MGQLREILRIVLTCVILFATTAKASENEGGAVSSNAGEIQWDCDPVHHDGKPTVFVITAADVGWCGSLRMKVNSMSDESMLHVYDSSHLSDEYTCGDRKNASWIGNQFNVNGRMATLVLNQQQCRSESTTFSVSWYCTSPIMDIAIASEDGAFVASESGMLSWTDVNAMQRHTTAIIGVNDVCLRVNSDFGHSSTHEICQGTRLAVYEITSEGCLAGIHEICGRKSSFKAEHISNNLLAVAEFNPSLTYGYSNSYEILWNEGECQVQDSCNTTPQPTTQPPEPTTEVVISRDCGGILDLSCGQQGKIFYKNGTNYGNNERCAWVIDSPTGAVDINFDNYTFETYYDGCVIGELHTDTSSFSCRKLVTADYTQPQRVNTPCVIQFTSDASITKRGFEISVIPVGDDCSRPYAVETFHSNSTDGTYRFPANGALVYANNTRALSVVQATPDARNRAVSYGIIDLEEPYDWTQIYTIGRYTLANPCNPWEVITGYHSAGTYAANTTADTFVSMTTTDRTGPATGFTLNWESSEMSVTVMGKELPKVPKHGAVMQEDKPLRNL